MKILASILFTITATMAGTLADQLDVHLTDNKRNQTDSRFCLAETANFGSAYLFWSMRGVVVNAAPMNGCQPVQPPPYQRNDSLAWVALIARDRSLADGCPFDRKVFNAQMAGFDAALVYNYEDSVLTMQPSDVGSHIRIPAAMVTFSCGVSLRTSYAYSVMGNRYSVSFEVPFPFDFHIYVISFAVIIGVCLVLSLLVWGIKLYRDWRRSRRNRLPRSSLKKLKVKKFEKGTDPYECCAICLEDFESGERLRILPCNHAYHTKCVDQWLLKSRSTCPVCKRRVFPRSEDSDDEGDGAGVSGGTENVGNVAGPSGVAAVVGGVGASAAVAETSSLQDERTPLLSSAGAASASTLATTSATATTMAAAPAASSACDGGAFDNAALTDDSTVEDGTDVESVDSDAAATEVTTAAAPAAATAVGSVSVEVVVHRTQDEVAGGGATAEV